MATAEVYCKWSNQGDGNRGSGAWSKQGEALAANSGNGGIIPLTMHAERVAWRTAWPAIQQYVKNTIANFPHQRFEVKFWVDQQICPTCQKWLLIDVISQMKQLTSSHPGLITELYAEVLFAGKVRRMRIQRTAIWPVEIGNRSSYDQLPAIYS